MANNELAVRFTEEMYATKLEVSKELRMTLIDNIWSGILSYRADYSRYLSIKSIEKVQYSICLCKTVSARIDSLDRKLIKSASEYLRLIDDQSSEFKQYTEACYLNNLRYIAKAHNLEIDNVSLKGIVRGDTRSLSGEYSILPRYNAALNYVKTKFMNNINFDYIRDLYNTLLNEDTSYIYRMHEEKDPNNRVLIDRIYNAAPYQLIEGMMNSLISFMETSTLSSSTKAMCVYYYINYVRPFSYYNEEMAILLAKSILAHIDTAEYTVCLPLEKIVKKDEQLQKIFIEVQKTKDITYLVNALNGIFEMAISEAKDVKINLETDEIKRDFYREDVAVEVKKEVHEQPSIFDFNVEEKENVKEQISEPVEFVKPKVEVKEVIKPVERPLPKEEVKEIPQPVTKEAPVYEGIAYNFIPTQLDEKQAVRLEEHLLEIEPSMKKGEAKFYARHCTMNKKYTIQQYKKYIGCAYETARTSMDHLVELGYYRKEMVKNKNVYTPIKQN